MTTIVPNTVNALLKKVGGERIQNVEIDALNQPGFTITSAMREKAAGGLPLFSIGENSTGLPRAKVSSITNPTTVAALQKAIRQLTGRLTPTSKLHETFMVGVTTLAI